MTDSQNPKEVKDLLLKQYINPPFVIFFAMDNSASCYWKSFPLFVGSVPFSKEHIGC